MKFNQIFTAAACALVPMLATAQADLTPDIIDPTPGSAVLIIKMSDNGKWGVSQTGSTVDGDIRPRGGVLINLETREQTPISHKSGLSGVSDVSDDGSIVVGECAQKPAFWSKATNSWSTLPLEEGFDLGRLFAVTPDGKYAVGYQGVGYDEMLAYPALYDLTTKQMISVEGMPELDMNHENTGQNCPYEISPDGRYIVGMLSQSILYPRSMCVYVYDVQEKNYRIVGFTEDDTKDWTPTVPYTYFLDRPALSPNGEWLTGFAYMVKPIPGSEWPDEDYYSFRYHLPTDKMEVYSDVTEANIAGFSIMNDGSIIAGAPAVNPYVSTMVRSGNYFVSLEQIFQQAYGIDLLETTGFPISGKCLSVSSDGRTLLLLPNMDQTYLIRFKEDIATAAAKVNLLATYNITPAPESVMSQVKTVDVKFDRDVAAKGAASRITLVSEDGKDSFKPVTNGGFVADGNYIKLTFRNANLREGVKYTLTIPQGSVTMKNDAAIVAPAITATFTGRESGPVKMTEAVPADGADVSHLDLTTNPVLLTFNSTVLANSDAPYAYLYRDGEDEAFCPMTVLTAKNQALVYPPVKQNLYDGTVYHVVIPAGTITDLSGAGANEEIVLTYNGIYKREISMDDKFLFADNCSSYDGFMFYEGDFRAPDPTASTWGFTADTTPWYVVRDEADETSNMALASHSMYSPPGQSDDWMVIPQLRIPDDKCYLKFLGQSYLAGVEDRLKVYVWAKDAVYNNVNAQFVKDVRAQGDLVFDERLRPGTSEENLVGDWQEYIVTLDKYAGKDIYICFVNDNDDQSAIFLDDIQVVHDLAYLTTIETPVRVVDLSEITIKGNIVFESEILKFNDVELTLVDAEGKELSQISAKGLNLSKGDHYAFEFPEPLKLTPGEVTPYSIKINFDGEETVVTSEVRDLVFMPNKRIVLEEYTGQECINCPLGVRGIENIESLYPGTLIPVTIHTFQSDPLGSGMSSYSQFLGLDGLGAPSGTINRRTPCYPMIQKSDASYSFTGHGIFNGITGKDEVLWYDDFVSEYNDPAEIGLSFASSYDPDSKTITVNAKVRNALNRASSSFNVFAVLLENKVQTYQKNGFYQITDPALGEWGAGGTYGKSLVYPYYAHDVARGTFGLTYNGSAGLLPSQWEAGKVYDASFTMPLPSTVLDPSQCDLAVMIIDNATGRVVNANSSYLGGEAEDTGVDMAVGGDNAGNCGMAVIDGALYVNGEGAFKAVAYDLAGIPVAQLDGKHGVNHVSLKGYTGILLVKVTEESGRVSTAKFNVVR